MTAEIRAFTIGDTVRHMNGREGTVLHVDQRTIRVRWDAGDIETLQIGYLQRIPGAFGMGELQGGRP